MTVFSAIMYSFQVSPKSTAIAIFWLITKRKVRGRNLLLNTATKHPRYYQWWIKYSEEKFIKNQLNKKNILKYTFEFSVFILIENEYEINSAIKTVNLVKKILGENTRIYTNKELFYYKNDISIITNSNIGEFIKKSCTPGVKNWILCLRAGDVFSKELISLISFQPDINNNKIVYWDEDKLYHGKRSAPFLKPDWDENLFLQRDFVTGSGVICAHAARDAMHDIGEQPVSAEALAELSIAVASQRALKVHHIPLVLSHRAHTGAFSSTKARAASIRKLWKEQVEVTPDPSHDSYNCIQYPLPAHPPSVSIIIPTRDHVELLRTCLEGVDRLDYPGRTEIIIIDNGSSDTECLDYLEERARRGDRVLHDTSAFNFSKLNNWAARQATGEFLCLLNNDIEMQDGKWLSQLVRQAARPGVGAVGATLLYPDGTIQHAGVAIGIGGAAGHVHRGVGLLAPGHHRLHRLTRRVSAVTAACLLVRRDVYMRVGGLDETRFPVAFNDVDFCLKLADIGLQNIFVGEAQLIHHESRSRGNDLAAENFARYNRELTQLRTRWNTQEFRDPFHHPLLLRSSEQFVLAPQGLL